MEGNCRDQGTEKLPCECKSTRTEKCKGSVRGIKSKAPRITREGNGTPLQYSCLENPMDGGAWWAAVHGVAQSQTRLSNFTFIFTFMHWRRKWQPTPVFLPGESQDGGAWWAAVYGVAQSWTRLKRLSSSSSAGCWAELLPVLVLLQKKPQKC